MHFCMVARTEFAWRSVEVVNCYGSYVLLCHISDKIAISPHNHTRIQCHHIREKTKQEYCTYPFQSNISHPVRRQEANSNFNEQPKDKHNHHQSTAHVLVQSSVVCVLAKLLQVRAIEMKDAGLLSLLVHIRSIQKKPPQLLSISR